ncbi:MAG TPA: GH116 family glycosyl hydrolase [Terracidiphilus sp.]|nr:GH116 family glycosyl hydrolase [Terracidiphilus sp.]
MTLSRRKFLLNAGAVGGAALTSLPAAPYQVTMRDKSHGVASGPHTTPMPVAIPATMPMGSGAPLGGIGTGFVEVRADGCFYEWQIFNSGPWARNARSTTAPPPPGPQYLRFVLRTSGASDIAAQVRRLYLRSDENDLYSLPMLHDVESIDYYARFPITELHYHDSTLPLSVSARIFSPMIPGNARDSATPGFHVVYTIENTGKEKAAVTLAGFLDNPLASALAERKLTNTLSRERGATRILMNTAAESDFPSGIGNMCFSVTGGDPSFITGTFHDYAWPGAADWNTARIGRMVVSVIEELITTCKLPNTNGETDPRIGLPPLATIESLSPNAVQDLVQKLGSDALLARIFRDAHAADPNGGTEADRALLKEMVQNLSGENPRSHRAWGSAALASTIELEPGQRAEIRFTLSWFFPNHLTVDGHFMGHMYSNWFQDAAAVNSFLCANYDRHRAATEKFARTLADTSLGDAMAFSWSSQLSSLITNTWWTKDSHYAIWEGLGCCGLSTTDVDYDGSFPVIALFPQLKMSQMKQIITFQNELGQVPHTYSADVHRVDNGFMRVDMNPQFVMMVCRDYLWTGDREYLTDLWPNIVRAMAFTESLDTNGDALPDRDTGLQTYDQWRMRGTPSYIASLWIGALRAAARIATDLGKHDEAARWSKLLTQASANFDKLLFNGDYFSLWVDGQTRDELCMTDQISGEWFSQLIGLPGTSSQQNITRAIHSVFKYNFNPEFGLHNATGPKGGAELLALNNLQAGGLWSGIEFAFASFLMDNGRYADGVRIVETIHRRYLRAGQPWNHVECGGHYSRAMSSWATMLASTGFKPDLANGALEIAPTAPGDFHAPWFTAAAYGAIRRVGRILSIQCLSGKLDLRRIKTAPAAKSISFNGRRLDAQLASTHDAATFEFSSPVPLAENDAISISLASI